MNKKATKTNLASSLLFSAGEIYILHLAVTGSQAAENVISFWCVVAGLCGLLLMVSINNKDALSKIKKKPRWYRVTVSALDVFIVATLASQGWFWCASLFLFAVFIQAIIYSKAMEGEQE